MPIKRKDFDTGVFKGALYSSDRKKHPVSVLLRKNVNLAYTVEEICKQTKMNEDAVRSMLRVLKQEDKTIVHKSPYFAWKKK
jgi:hypothetical protein